MADLPVIPPPLGSDTSKLLSLDLPMDQSTMEKSFDVMQNSALRLRESWIARPDDVFLVFPMPLISDGFVAFSAALVEQRDVASVDLAFPRYIDAGVSRRGWPYIQAIDTWCARRCLTTHAPPWLFPCRNSGLAGEARSSLGSSTSRPRIAIFVSDPRYMMMKHLQAAKCILGSRIQSQMDFDAILEAVLGRAHFGPVPFDHGVATSLAWAEAEARDPERIRLFFIEDFVLHPEVAMRGLARFLGVSELTDATEQTIRDAHRLTTISHKDKLKATCPLFNDLAAVGAFEDIVHDFERRLASASKGVQAAWDDTLKCWLTSQNPRMVSWATSALQHDVWNPPQWWASHNARLCRPCLYFPRGTCHNERCAFCHGPGHHKPKRPSRSRRARRKGEGGNREPTPSPERTWNGIEPNYDQQYRPKPLYFQ